MEQLAIEITDILADHLAVDPGLIDSDATLAADLGMDSLDAYAVITTIYQRYDVSIRDDDARTLETVGDLIDCVRRYLEAQRLSAEQSTPISP